MSHDISEPSKQYTKMHGVDYVLSLPRAVWTNRKLAKRRELFDAFYRQLIDTIEGGSLRVRVEHFSGIFEFNCRSHILRKILEEKQFEPEIAGLIAKTLDSKRDAVDVGANVGLYSVLLSKGLNRGRKVLAIEPTPAALKYLYKNLESNGCSKSVIVYEGIATDRKGAFQLNVIPGMEEYSSLGLIVHESARNENSLPIRIKGDSIDALVRRYKLSPGLLKIDTEGAEYQVLSGAKVTLAKHKPVVISELSDKMLSSMHTNSQMVVNLLVQHEYKVTSIENPGKPVTFPYEGEIIAIPQKDLV
jgi:FkbM family methyltransferase